MTVRGRFRSQVVGSIVSRQTVGSLAPGLGGGSSPHVVVSKKRGGSLAPGTYTSVGIRRLSAQSQPTN